MTDPVDAWHAHLKSRDPAALDALLHPDVVLDSPILHTPQRGRETVKLYLAGAFAVLGTPQFRYVGEWRNDGGAVLEFETERDGVRINGVDIFTFAPDGRRIIGIKVMLRPLKAINLVHAAMGALLAQAR